MKGLISGSVVRLQNWKTGADQKPDDASSIDPELLSLRGNPTGTSLLLLTAAARHLSAVPGRKNVVWISTDNVLADRPAQKGGVDQGSTPIGSLGLRAQEAMNEAHASVYPCDVSQLEGGAVDASLEHRNELIHRVIGSGDFFSFDQHAAEDLIGKIKT